MKTLKTITIAFLCLATLVACKNDDDNAEAAFVLTNSNLAGDHDLSFLTVNAQVTQVVAGVDVVADINGQGDTFQTTANFTSNGTFIFDGQFRINTTVTINGGDPTPRPVIVNLDNETGSYTIGGNADTIVFTGVMDVQITPDVAIDLFNGAWDVTLFNETELRLQKMENTSIDGIDTVANVEIRFLRQ
ncbi:MAG TPA: hypothetical protein EYN07_01640 [Flavobacteriaceae bacterium]|jgi:hypothetical protein|nr:hypothetical protein [Flavobacteriaceae bacterium]MAM28243.1 hypothetical protein [Flavobacteriaceae bacterium]HBR53128.1 hypothetical protein [Flavobacteriaceae bacterium]HIB47628.1 hypothetical protein [Flavobacteriaceae bacterium]HIN97922.1 hypothetical protein [Flavobacteriaceae bacterium]|tara:strand:+ start:211 stop:777 length:567 start_codon:yes stop_codon:yes gene_type:complete